MRKRVSLIFYALALVLLITAALLALPAPPAESLRGDAAKAKDNFDRYCKTCHGPEGKGDGVLAPYLDPKPKDLSDGERMGKLSDEEIYKVIKEGGPAIGLSSKMAAWGQVLSDQEVKDLVALIRSFPGKPAP